MCTKIVLNVRNNFGTQHPGFSLKFSCIELEKSVVILMWVMYLVDEKIRAPDKDLPVQVIFCWTDALFLQLKQNLTSDCHQSKNFAHEIITKRSYHTTQNSISKKDSFVTFWFK